MSNNQSKYGNIVMTTKRITVKGYTLKQWQEKCNAHQHPLGFSYPQMYDKLAAYESIGEPEELVKPVRCGACKHAEDVCKNPGDYIAPYWCHECEKRMSAIDYCSYGELREGANA